ncbi:hypothetical protein [Georgenia wangjunii]|uniref:hypothetical protein n=1 Tax=Georgenia wangjunii TaxID=3117730 RepID=UPI002F2694AF
MSVEAPYRAPEREVEQAAEDAADPDGRRARSRPAQRLVDQHERIAAARQALQRAETAAGMRTRLTGPTALRPTGQDGPTGRGAGEVAVRDRRSSPVDGPASEEHRSPAGDTSAAGGYPSSVGEDHLPVPRALLPLFPGGGVRRGSVVQVAGSTSLLLALAAAAAQDGAWSALAAMPDVGLQAAAEAGLALERVVMVPRPGPDAPAVLGALVDGFDILVVGDCRALTDRDRRLLVSRLRTREAVLLSTRPWPGSDLVLEAEHVLEAGRLPGAGDRSVLGGGHAAPGAGGVEVALGTPRRREVAVRVRGRGAGGRGGQVRVSVGVGGLEAVPAGGLVSAGGLESVPVGGLRPVGAVRGSADLVPELRAV